MTRLSPRRLRPSDLPHVTLSSRHAGELIAHPCDCGRDDCTLGEHVWRTTKDLEPGVRAQALDRVPRGNETTIPFPDIDEPADPTDGLHRELCKAITDLHNAAELVAGLIGDHRPDRTLKEKPEYSDEDWCRHHLDMLGSCEPRYKGDECRKCNEWRRGTGIMPPLMILRAWDRGERITDAMVMEAKRAAKLARRKRRKAS